MYCLDCAQLIRSVALIGIKSDQSAMKGEREKFT
jgi:hypothetical protein